MKRLRLITLASAGIALAALFMLAGSCRKSVDGGGGGIDSTSVKKVCPPGYQDSSGYCVWTAGLAMTNYGYLMFETEFRSSIWVTCDKGPFLDTTYVGFDTSRRTGTDLPVNVVHSVTPKTYMWEPCTSLPNLYPDPIKGDSVTFELYGCTDEHLMFKGRFNLTKDTLRTIYYTPVYANEPSPTIYKATFTRAWRIK